MLFKCYSLVFCYIDRLLSKIQSDGSISCINSNYDACMYHGLEKEMLDKTGSERCTTPWIINAKRICKKSDNIKTACMIDKNQVLNKQHHCRMPCESLGISVGDISHVNKPNIREWKILFPSRILLTEEKYLFTFKNLIAEIGGLLGLSRNTYWIVMVFLGYVLQLKVVLEQRYFELRGP